MAEAVDAQLLNDQGLEQSAGQKMENSRQGQPNKKWARRYSQKGN